MQNSPARRATFTYAAICLAAMGAVGCGGKSANVIGTAPVSPIVGAPDGFYPQFLGGSIVLSGNPAGPFSPGSPGIYVNGVFTAMPPVYTYCQPLFMAEDTVFGVHYLPPQPNPFGFAWNLSSGEVTDLGLNVPYMPSPSGNKVALQTVVNGLPFEGWIYSGVTILDVPTGKTVTLAFPSNVLLLNGVVTDAGSFACAIVTDTEDSRRTLYGRSRAANPLGRLTDGTSIRKAIASLRQSAGVISSYTFEWFSPDGAMSNLPIVGTSTYSTPIIVAANAYGTIAGEVANFQTGYTGINLPAVWLAGGTAPILLSTPDGALGDVTGMTPSGAVCGNYWPANKAISSGIIWPQPTSDPTAYNDLSAQKPLPNGAQITNVIGLDSQRQEYMAEVQSASGANTYQIFAMPNFPVVRHIGRFP